MRVEVAANRGDDARPQCDVGARLLVHEQVEVALAIARLGIGQAVKSVRERAFDLGEQLESQNEKRRLPALGLCRYACYADDVTRTDFLGLRRKVLRRHELDPT